MSLAKKVEHIQNSADFSAANSGWGFFLPPLDTLPDVIEISPIETGWGYVSYSDW